METVNCIRCDFRHKDNGNCTAVGGFCTAVAAAHCPLLREYLDTELTPEEVNDAVVAAKLMAKAKVVSAFGVAAERLRELAEADKAGRVVKRRSRCEKTDRSWARRSNATSTARRAVLRSERGESTAKSSGNLPATAFTSSHRSTMHQTMWSSKPV